MRIKGILMKLFLTLLLLISCISSSANVETISNLNDKEIEIRTNLLDKVDNEIKSIAYEAQLAFNTKNFDKCLRLNEKVLGYNLQNHQELNAKVLVGKALCYKELGKVDKEVATYNELIQKFKDTENPSIQTIVAFSYANKGVSLIALGKRSDSVPVFDELITKFEDSEITKVQEVVAHAYLFKGLSVGNLGKPTDAVPIFDELIAKFKDSETHVIKKVVGLAYQFKETAFRLEK